MFLYIVFPQTKFAAPLKALLDKNRMLLIKVFPPTKFAVPLKALIQTKWGVALQSVPTDKI